MFVLFTKYHSAIGYDLAQELNRVVRDPVAYYVGSVAQEIKPDTGPRTSGRGTHPGPETRGMANKTKKMLAHSPNYRKPRDSRLRFPGSWWEQLTQGTK